MPTTAGVLAGPPLLLSNRPGTTCLKSSAATGDAAASPPVVAMIEVADRFNPVKRGINDLRRHKAFFSGKEKVFFLILSFLGIQGNPGIIGLASARSLPFSISIHEIKRWSIRSADQRQSRMSAYFQEKKTTITSVGSLVSQAKS